MIYLHKAAIFNYNHYVSPFVKDKLRGYIMSLKIHHKNIFWVSGHLLENGFAYFSFFSSVPRHPRVVTEHLQVALDEDERNSNMKNV